MKKLLLAILMCLALCGPGWGAVITRYVNTASSGGNGTTNETSGANAAYASLSAWEAAENQDLTDGGGDSMVVWCSGTTADTANYVVIDGWTTSETNTITINGNNTSGKYDTSKYRLEHKEALNPEIAILDDYVYINNMQINNDATSGGGIKSYNNGTVITNSVVITGGESYYCFSATTYTVINSVGISKGDENRATFRSQNSTFNVYNSIGINTGAGYAFRRESGTYTIKNSYGYSVSADDYNGTMTQTTNASADATAGGTAGDNIAYSTSSGAYFTNVTSGSEDFHITNGASSLNNTGTDLSGTFTTDIDSDTRVNWDIGVDYISADAGSAATTRIRVIEE